MSTPELPPPDKPKPHLSPSAVNLYHNCGEAYYRRYICGDKTPPNAAMLKGTGVHGGAKRNFRQKLETRQDLPVEEVVAAAVDAFDSELPNGVAPDPGDDRSMDVVLGEARDQVVAMARVQSREVFPEYQPTLVEETVRLTLPDASHDMLGVIDLIDERTIVVDHKTGTKAKSQSDVDDNLQLSIYAALHKSLRGELPAEVRLETIINGKREIKRQMLSSTRDENDMQALSYRIGVVTAGINAGLFMPAPVGSWMCSERWCGYWSTCPYVNSQRKAAAEANAKLAPPDPPANLPQNHGAVPADVEPEFFPPVPAAPNALILAPTPAPAPAGTVWDTANPDSQGFKLSAPTPRQKANKTLKQRLLADNPHCKWCGKRLTPKTATLDHVVPLAHGGSNAEENQCLACGECNAARADTGLHPADVQQ